MTIANKPTVFQGVLEMHPKGFGFLRDPARHYAARPTDPYVGQPLIQKFGLKQGLLVAGPIEPPRRGATGPRLAAIDHIEGAEAKLFRRRNWDELTPVDPTQWLQLETGAEPLTTRVMDLFTPIGKGQRGLIVAPPRSGKTVLLSHIADSISSLYPEMHLIVLLVDERPEEVTEFRRTVKGEVVASSNDQDAIVHVRTAELVMERAKRLTEQGRDVFVLLDSLTRLARAYNKQTGSGGRTMSGGVDSRAMDIPKRLFGAARAFEEGGTLTILGTALIETNSRMDDVIFQEFKGTGNMELVLDRKLADKRIYPSIDLSQSGTRKEERILPPDMLERINLLRRSLLQMRRPDEAMEALVKQLGKTTSNDEFLNTVGKFVGK
ncbi:transcription termination factor Rho [Fimbriiglobus ruber]|uniref:Transcription termination factor Rho n=1 Tax=Fimbriiglobus ruber TaxID=1908690 RepID=A0A225DV73_9BACT|nr:transcription termination factor Rho [Fimbriiglobus ruber]OWK41069.1 Transcription termination factor Rho [Fimbriiglobus ruber]